MAIGAGAAGAWVAANAVSQTVTLPTHATGDLLVLIVAAKLPTPASALLDAGASTGWTRVGYFADGSVASGTGTGSVFQGVWFRVATSSAETSPTVTFGGAQVAAPSVAVALCFTKGSGEGWLNPVVVQAATNAATSISVAMGSNPGITAGDVGVVVHTTADDSALTVPTWSATGATLGTATVFPTTPIATTTSNDMAATAAYRAVTSGTASAAPVCTATQAAAETGVTAFIRLRVATEPTGTTIYPTTTASAVATASNDLEAWTSRGGTAVNTTAASVTGPSSPIHMRYGGSVVDWFTKPLAAFTLTGPVRVKASGDLSGSSNTAFVVEVAQVEGDGTSPTVWGSVTTGRLTTSSSAFTLVLDQFSGLAISDGQRLRIRVYIDDAPTYVMVASASGAFYRFNGPTLDAQGDSSLTFSQTLTEYSASSPQDVTLPLLDSAPDLHPLTINIPGFKYVAPAGSDTTGDGSIGNPWRTIQKFLLTAGSGDTLYVRGGTYQGADIGNILTGALGYNPGGSVGAPITVMAYPGEVPLFLGTSPTPETYFWNFQDGSHYYVVDGLHFDDWHVTGTAVFTATGTALAYSDHLRWTNIVGQMATNDNTAHFFYAGGYTDHIEVDHNDVDGVGTNSNGSAAEVFHTDGSNFVNIHHNHFTNWTQGVQIYDPAANDISVEHNTFQGCFNNIDARFGDTNIVVRDNAGTDGSNTNVYDPNGIIDTLSNNVWGLVVPTTLTSDGSLPTGSPAIAAAHDGSDAGWREYVAVVYGAWSTTYSNPVVSAQVITVPLLDGGPAVYAPTLLAKSLLTVPVLDAVAAVYAPTLVAKNLLTIPSLDALPAVYAPAVSTTITLGLLTSTSALYSPTVIPGPVGLTVPALDAVSATYSPTLVPGPAAITLGLLDSSSALYQPTAIRDEFVTLGLIDAVSALYAPAILQAQFLTIPTLDAGPALSAPSLAVGPVALTVPLLDALRSVTAPSLSVTVSLGFLDAGPALYAPLVAQSQFITLAQLDAAPAVYAPTLVPAALGLTLPQLDSGPALYAPVAYLDQFVTLGLVDAGAAVYAPSLGVTIALVLLDSGSALYAPVAYLDQFVTLPLVDAGPAVFSPSLSAVVALPQLDSGPALYAPVAFLDQFVTAPLLDAAPTVYAPSLSVTVSLGLIDSGSALYGPTLTVGAVTISLGLLDAAGAVYTPVLSSVAGGSQSLLLDTIDGAATVYAPIVAPQPITVSLALLDAISALYAPVVIIDQFVTVPLLDAAAATYAPTLAAGGVGLTLPQLDSGPALYAPVAYLDQFLTVPLLDAAATVYAPSLTAIGGSSQALTLGTIDAVAAVYAPSLAAGYLITIPQLDAGPALYAPTAYLDQFVTLPALDGGAAVYAPALVPATATISLELIDSGPTVYAPVATFPTKSVTLALLDAGPALYAPTLATVVTVTVPLLDAANAVYEPAVTFPVKSLTIPVLTSVSAVYAPTLVQGSAIITLPLLVSDPTFYPLIVTGGAQEEFGGRGGHPILVITKPPEPVLITVSADLYINYEIRERIAVALSLSSAIRVHAGLDLRQDHSIRNRITRELELDHTIVDWHDTNQDVLLAEIDEDLVLLS